MAYDSVAAFISPHGFGHAARCVATLQALRAIRPSARFEIFTGVPRWFFEDSLEPPFGYHEVVVDVGMVQKTALKENTDATVTALDRFLPFQDDNLEALARALDTLGTKAVVADISPLGLAAAEAAGLPSLLLSNFTWDWIYAGYSDDTPELKRFIKPLQKLFDTATVRLETEPCCEPTDDAVRIGPISRSPKENIATTRTRLGIADDAPMVLLTMGGIEFRYRFLDRLRENEDLTFVVPGGAKQPERRGNLRLLPHHSEHYHPDLVYAADVVVGKLGYSTVAEVAQAGGRMAYVERDGFPESPILAEFVESRLPCVRIAADTFTKAAWVEDLPELLALERPAVPKQNGAVAAAEKLNELLDPVSPKSDD